MNRAFFSKVGPLPALAFLMALLSAFTAGFVSGCQGGPVRRDTLAVPAFAADVTARDWNHIVIHHSATDSGNAHEFDRMHRARGWEYGLGYHFVIGNGNGSDDGKIEVGGRWVKQLHGAHAGVKQYNYHGIGICLVGNFEIAHPTAKQWQSLTRLVAALMRQYNIPSGELYRHVDVKSATLCPGANMPFDRLLREVSSLSQATGESEANR